MKFEYKVYMADTDYGRVVYFANYLRFAEQAKTDAFSEIGLDEMYWDEEHSTGIMVRSADVQFKGPLTYLDVAVVEIDSVSAGRINLELNFRISKKSDGLVAATVKLQMVVVDSKALKPKKPNEELRNILSKLERNE